MMQPWQLHVPDTQPDLAPVQVTQSTPPEPHAEGEVPPTQPHEPAQHPWQQEPE